MSDLIERLRGENKGGDIGHEAADRIEELQAENERLTAVYEAAKVIQYKQVAATASEFVDLQEALAAVEGKDDD